MKKKNNFCQCAGIKVPEHFPQKEEKTGHPDKKEALTVQHLPKWTGCLLGHRMRVSSADPQAAVRTGCCLPALNPQNWTFLIVYYPEQSQNGGLGVWGGKQSKQNKTKTGSCFVNKEIHWNIRTFQFCLSLLALLFNPRILFMITKGIFLDQKFPPAWHQPLKEKP